jgi:hypothetical protein
LDANGVQMTVAQVAAANAAAAAAAAAGTAVANATVAAGTAATTAATAAAANAAAATTLSTTAAATPVAFAVDVAHAVTGAISLTWANNPANVVAATGVTNVTGFTLTWAGATSGSVSIPVGATGATLTGLTSGGSYDFTLVANAPAGASTAATITGSVAP